MIQLEMTFTGNFFPNISNECLVNKFNTNRLNLLWMEPTTIIDSTQYLKHFDSKIYGRLNGVISQYIYGHIYNNHNFGNKTLKVEMDQIQCM